MLLAHHPGFSCPLCRSFADLEGDVEVEVPDGYLHFGGEGAIINDLDGVLPEEPQQQQQQRQQQQQQSMINPDDTSELARASEAIYISGNSSNSGGLSGSGATGQQQRQQQASNATPPVTSGPAVHNENSEGEGSEADVMITSEVEDQDHRLRPSNTRPQRETVDDSSEDDNDEAADPGARAARSMYRRGQTHIDGEEDDEDEEDEVHAHVASV